jgi:hypothetical protein
MFLRGQLHFTSLILQLWVPKKWPGRSEPGLLVSKRNLPVILHAAKPFVLGFGQ